MLGSDLRSLIIDEIVAPDSCLSWKIMISQPFVLPRKWNLSMIGAVLTGGKPPERSESDCVGPQTQIETSRIPISDLLFGHWC